MRSREVHRAFSVSMAIHLLILAIWLLGGAFHVWNLIPSFRFAKDLDERFLRISQQTRDDFTPGKPAPDAEETPLMFVEVDTSKAVTEAPADAKLYGAVNTLAANPEIASEALPKIEGKQDDFLKILENGKSDVMPVPPRPPRLEKNVSPKTPEPKQTKPQALASDPASPKTLENKPVAPKPSATPVVSKQTPPPPVETPRIETKKVNEVASASPEPVEKAPAERAKIPESNSGKESNLAVSDPLDAEKKLERDLEGPKREQEKVTQVASTKPIHTEKVSPPEEQKSEPTFDQNVPRSDDPLENVSAFADPEPKQLLLAKTSPSQTFNQNPEEGNNPLDNPTTVRPRKLDEVKRTPGEKSSVEGGVQRYDLSASLAAKGTIVGDYDQRFVQAVRQRWDTLLGGLPSTLPGKVVLDFRIHVDGRVSQVAVHETTVSNVQTLICQNSILDPAPYSPWPSAMRNELKSDWRDVTFTFYYLP